MCAVAEQIRAEMVANVLSLLVASGDTVEAGQAVVIMESMKMEIPVLAEYRRHRDRCFGDRG